MNPGSPCPSPDVWRRWLRRWIEPSPEEQQRLAQHLEGCSACRRLFAAEYIRLQISEFASLDHIVPEVLARVEWCLREPVPDSASATPPTVAMSPAAVEEIIKPAAIPVRPEKPTPSDAAADAPAAKARRPRIFGNYCLYRRLGEGAMGVVFEAEDMRTRKRVALKLMKPELANNVTSRQRFLREAQAASALQHSNVVAIHEVGELSEIPFIAMEYLVGESLRDRIKRGGAMPWREACRIATEVADGLAAAHRQGLVHRDVKPANIWLQHPGQRVKLLDFGLVRLQHQDVELTREGLTVGTPAYMSPEQIRGQNVDGRSDLFSLGVVLYECLTGKRPFSGDQVLAVMAQVLTHDPAPPRQLNPQVPEAVSRLVMQLLAKDPARRPASASEVAENLRQLIRSPSSQPAAPEHKHDKPDSPQSVQPKTVEPTLGGTPWVYWPAPSSTSPREEPEPREPVPPRPRKRKKSRPPESPWNQWLLLAAVIVLPAALLLFIGHQLLEWFREKPGLVAVEVEEKAMPFWKNAELRIYSDKDRIAAVLRPNMPTVELPPGRYWAVLPREWTAQLQVDKFEFQVEANRRTMLTVRLRGDIGQPAPKPEEKLPEEPLPKPIPPAEQPPGQELQPPGEGKVS
jgi:serine/threonine protein kinase